MRRCLPFGSLPGSGYVTLLLAGSNPPLTFPPPGCLLQQFSVNLPSCTLHADSSPSSAWSPHWPGRVESRTEVAHFTSGPVPAEVSINRDRSLSPGSSYLKCTHASVAPSSPQVVTPRSFPIAYDPAHSTIEQKGINTSLKPQLDAWVGTVSNLPPSESWLQSSCSHGVVPVTCIQLGRSTSDIRFFLRPESYRRSAA